MEILLDTGPRLGMKSQAARITAAAPSAVLQAVLMSAGLAFGSAILVLSLLGKF
jgi:hypothetical protein